LIEGRLRYDQWEDKQTGQKRSKLGVVMETFQFLGIPAAAEGGEASAAAPRPRPAAPIRARVRWRRRPTAPPKATTFRSDFPGDFSQPSNFNFQLISYGKN
jgi:single-strand DNA-binding protein